MPALQLSRARLPATTTIDVMDAYGDTRPQAIAAERALTVYLNKREIVTLMTLGDDPEALVVGYLRNQGLLRNAEDLTAVQVDWDVEAAVIVTRHLPDDLEARLSTRTVTTGCGQGTVFGKLLEQTSLTALPETPLAQSTLYQLLTNLNTYNDTYRSAGAVHGCALCHDTEPLIFIEDVGRHNAVDAIAGKMWLEGISGNDKIFYTTGRLTSEMVIKVAQMEIPVLLSRSGITKMGLNLARDMNVTLLSRAKNKHFLIYNGAENIEFDVELPPKREVANIVK